MKLQNAILFFFYIKNQAVFNQKTNNNHHPLMHFN